MHYQLSFITYFSNYCLFHKIDYSLNFVSLGSLRDEVQPQRRLYGVEVDRRRRLSAVQVRRRSRRQEDGEVCQQLDEAHGKQGKQLKWSNK